ncbi:MAG: YicC family protein [Clostridia bacterium]|nr:YicC family protein [Clostridia bacterium]
MARSMTAYGRSTGTCEGKNITVEIKSVNSRYFDPSIKITRNYSYLEEKIKSYIQTRISRGKVDFWLGVDIVENIGCDIALDSAYVESYIHALEALRDQFGLKDDISVMRVAANRDIFIVTKPEEDLEKIWAEVLPFVDEALSAFCDMREREGANLCRDLNEKKENIKRIVAKISERSAECVQQHREKLETRIKQLLEGYQINIDEQRILTESAIFADKIAIDEELVRLASHFDAFDEILKSKEPVGRKLDFLVQEMNRETNTIGSKCNDAEIAHCVVDIKCEIEKIREQVQNLE